MPELDIRLDRNSNEPEAAQVFNQISSAILAGKFNPGDRLPSEHELARRLGVSRNSVHGAYCKLEEAGLVETSGASGRQVRATAKRSSGL